MVIESQIVPVSLANRQSVDFLQFDSIVIIQLTILSTFIPAINHPIHLPRLAKIAEGVKSWQRIWLGLRYDASTNAFFWVNGTIVDRTAHYFPFHNADVPQPVCLATL